MNVDLNRHHLDEKTIGTRLMATFPATAGAINASEHQRRERRAVSAARHCGTRIQESQPRSAVHFDFLSPNIFQKLGAGVTSQI